MLVAMLLLTLCFAWRVVSTIFFSHTSSALGNLLLYKWMAVGIIGYAVVHRFVTKNISWLETFSHELTHTVVALIFLRRVHSFNASEKSGQVSTSGDSGMSLVPMTLAPYCLPIFTYLALMLRCLIAGDALWIYDILLGVTVGFHFYCFKTQTGNHQTDINKYPLSFSYLYIGTFVLFNILILLVSLWPSRNVFNALWLFVTSSWDTLTNLL